MEQYGDLKFFQYRVRELEDKVEQLRLSRRVLMNLVEKLEKEKTYILARLKQKTADCTGITTNMHAGC